MKMKMMTRKAQKNSIQSGKSKRLTKRSMRGCLGGAWYIDVRKKIDEWIKSV